MIKCKNCYWFINEDDVIKAKKLGIFEKTLSDHYFNEHRSIKHIIENNFERIVKNETTPITVGNKSP